ncbi:hypothetical protein E4L95_05630 [Paracoccus liaowanqingii]|uniref:Uncharacterized protein n=1 Tax=Paracoccus liaowanqingii TaxID=2560053 RepID=A0A4Z1CQJ6_9RHOB|nr:hypothetical protein [Paracoccus liaowanqingii]TGN67268.1 hypothetical protein E4L95_05630 [Paracoccus liaowanqingii]
MFKLESFSDAVAKRPVEVTFSRADLDQAFANGQSAAQAEAEDAGLRALQDGLHRLADSLAEDEARRHRLRQEAVEALSPLLHQILDLMAPPRSSHRLEEALQAELLRLSQRADPLSARIACGSGLRPMVQHCMDVAGLDGIVLDEIALDRISVTLQGGRIELAPEDIADNIRALIAEITEEDGTWTP